MTRSVLWAATLVVALVGCEKKEDGAKGQAKPAANAKKPEADKKPEPPKQPEPPKKPMTGEEIGAKWKECIGYFSAHDEAKFGGCMTERTTSEFLDSGMPPATGAKAMVERAKLFWTGLPDVKVAPQLILVNGGNFATIDLVQGTNTGSFMGQPASGKKVGYYMAHFGEVDQATGEAKAVNGIMDMGSLMEQMGGKKPAVEQGWSDAGRVVVATDSETERANVAAWNKGLEGWNAHDADKAFADYADDAVVHDVGAGDVKGKKAITELMKGYWAGFSDLKGRYDAVWGAGDWVVAIGTSSGTNDGDMPAMGVKKTGKPVTLRLVEMARFEGGKVKDHWLFYNGMAMATQLGLVPPPAAAPAPPAK